MKYKLSGMQKVKSTGPSCKKRMFNSKEEAEESIKHIEETTHVKGLHAYQCQICGFFHLSSK